MHHHVGEPFREDSRSNARIRLFWSSNVVREARAMLLKMHSISVTSARSLAMQGAGRRGSRCCCCSCLKFTFGYVCGKKHEVRLKTCRGLQYMRASRVVARDRRNPMNAGDVDHHSSASFATVYPTQLPVGTPDGLQRRAEAALAQSHLAFAEEHKHTGRHKRAKTSGHKPWWLAKSFRRFQQRRRLARLTR